ncbi:lactate utilization protein C [Streptomyces sp. NPDC058664]|uniref:LutC/YkgG family protein n=1 Tax=unclassified Streptomyces TaxID=2593676 RepID=UPI00364F2B82
MTARDTVLGRVHDALSLAPRTPVAVPRDYRRDRTLPDTDRLALFTDRLVDYKARVHTCASAETPATLAGILTGLAVARVGVPAGLDPSWLAEWPGETVRDHADVPAPDLAALDAVVTAAAVGCAETGTIFLDGSADQGRRALTLVPDAHVCVVDLSQVAVGVPEALARLVPERPTTLISGPSATSDIELERVEGVHGPRTLIVVVRTDV